MRLFSAIPIPEAIQKDLIEMTRGKLPVPYLNLTNAHITINFFGDLDSDKTKFVIEQFPIVAQGSKKINIEFEKIVKNNHQLHLTVKPSEDLKNLQQYLQEAYERVGFTFADRDYYPHVSLARMHMDNHLYRARKVENFANEELSRLNFTADKVILYESKLLLHHAHHMPMAEVSLT